MRMRIILRIEDTSIVKDLLERVSYNVGLCSLSGHKSHKVVTDFLWDAGNLFRGFRSIFSQLSKIESHVTISTLRLNRVSEFLDFLRLGFFAWEYRCCGLGVFWNFNLHHRDLWCFILICDLNNFWTTRRGILVKI